MTGIIMMGAGVVLFIAGFTVYKSEKNPKVKLNNEQQLNQYVDAAIADGNLTNLEERKLTELAEQNNMEASLWIKVAKTRIQKSVNNSEIELNELVKDSKREIVKLPLDLEKQMNHYIDIAITDGVLTKREEQKITELANENNMDATLWIQEAKNRIQNSEDESETEIIDHIKKSGDHFEKYVVQKFSRKYFNVKEWAGDKYVNGIYADTTAQPDLMMEFSLKGSKETFSVECKWRKEFVNEALTFATPDQLSRYKAFEIDRNIPVFIALGVGGKASSPDELYILPLKEMKTTTVKKTAIRKYTHNLEKGLYYDAENNMLK
ncbi:MAG: hypothetical protein WED33_13730 [Bacteroidia bacterium]